MPTQAETSIWNGSHGPTPAVNRAEANSEVTPSTKPNPGPKTRPASTSRKNTSSTPPVPADKPRRIAITALSTPSTASTRVSRPPSLSSASTTAITIGRSARNRNGGSIRSVGCIRSSSGQTSIISPPSEAMVRISAERRETGTAFIAPPPGPG